MGIQQEHRHAFPVVDFEALHRQIVEVFATPMMLGNAWKDVEY